MAADAVTDDPAPMVAAAQPSSGARRARQAVRVRQGVTALLVVLLGILAVRVLFALITPIARPSPDAELRAATPQPVDLTVFTRFDPFEGNAPAVEAPVVQEASETRLALKLLGTFLGDPASATVRAGDGREDVYRVGDDISAGVTVEEIHHDHILINRQGVVEALSLENRDRSAPVSTPSGNGAVSRAMAAPASLQAIGRYVRMRPSAEGGILLSPGTEPEFFTSAGFVQGDRLVEVEGHELSPGSPWLADLPAQLSQGPVGVVVERNGTRIELQVDLTGLTP